jgi:hypothetical protein
MRRSRRVLLFTGLLLSLCLVVSSCDRRRGGDDDDSAGDDDDSGAPPQVPDSDGDGLSDAEEELLGSDPENSDTDGDGYTDGEEVDAYTDPLDDSCYPYTGGWPRGPWPADLQSTGTSVGDIAENFVLTDQFGENVKLWSFYGQVVLIKNAAPW